MSTYFIGAFTEAELLAQGTAGTNIGKGDTFIMPATTSVTMEVVDNDSYLSGDHRTNENATDQTGQTATITENGVVTSSGEQIYAECYFWVQDQAGNWYIMIEIEVENEPGDYFSFYGDVPPAGSELTIYCAKNVKCDWINYCNLQDPNNPIPPMADDDAMVIDEDQTGMLNVLDNDFDTDGTITVSAVQGGTLGVPFLVESPEGYDAMVTLNADGSLTVVPGPEFEVMGDGQSTTLTFTYTIIDNDGLIDTATVTVTVNGVGGDIAIDDAYTVSESEDFGDVDGNVLDNDVDGNNDGQIDIVEANGNPNWVGAVIQGSNGGLATINPDGSFDFSANGEFDALNSGQSVDTHFTYAVQSGGGATADALIIPFTGPNNLEAQVTIIEVDGNLVFTVEVFTNGGDIGDIRGLFFDVSDESLLDGLTASGYDVTDQRFDANNVVDLGNGTNVSGDVVLNLGAFDAGTELGTQGIGRDDIRATTFQISHATQDLTLDLLMSQDFALRLTSVGDENGSREDSLKLAGQSGTVTEEVSTATVTVTVNGESAYVAVADTMTVMASEGAGDVDLLDTGDDSVLDNDLQDSGPYVGDVLAVNNDALNIGQMVAGTNGGLLNINTDGSVDFDANGEFAYLLDGQTAQTQFTYTIEDGETASVTVTVLGETVRVANDDVMTVMESETFGDADLLDTGDDSVLDNDTQNGGAYTDVVGAVNGSLGNVNSFVAGSMGGLLKIMADGSLDFDANGEFDGLASGETAQTTFTYELISGEMATVTVNVLGESNYVANDDVLTVMESETSGDTETLDSGAASILANDTTDGAAYGGTVEQVGGVAGDVGQVVVGSNGGLATIYADGTIDFDANDEFDFLNDGESAQTTFTYGIQGGDTATVTVNILGENDTTGPMPTINLALMMSSVITMFEQADTGLYGLPPYGDWNGNGVTGEVIDMAYLMLEDFMTDAFTLANNAGYNLNVSLISFDETAVGEGAQFYTVPDQGSFHSLLDTKVANDNSGDYGAGFDNANAWFDAVADVGDINAAFVIGNGFGTDPYVTEHANLLTDHGVIMDSFLPDVVFSGTAYTGMGAIDKDGVTDLVFHNDPASEALYGGPAGVNALSLDHLIA